MVKGTQVQGGPGEVEVGATRLLGLDGLTVVGVELDAEGGRIVHARTTEGFPPGCPQCGVISTSFKGSVVTHTRDVPYGLARVRHVWHKSRWRCRERLCPRGSFTESIRQVPARARVTARLRQEVGEAAADRFLLCAGRGWALSGVLADRECSADEAHRQAAGRSVAGCERVGHR